MTHAANRRRSHSFERLTHPVLPFPAFLRRAARHFGWGIVAVVVVDGLGTIGYRWLGNLPWIDAFLNASMIIGGMGPVDHLDRASAKLFAAVYALFSGLVFVALMGLVLAPWLHRMIHVMHAAEEK